MYREIIEKILNVIVEKQRFRAEMIEKDFYITVILNSINEKLSNNIIFKGGTLLNKAYLNYQRLSEDLDFSFLSKEPLDARSKRSKAMKSIRENMPAFLKMLELKSKNPDGEGFNNSYQYVFEIQYDSIITGKEENIKLEISLRQNPIEKPIENTIKHFYNDPFTGGKILPENKVLSLSLNETVAEKLKAATTRKDPVIRDYYDLYYIMRADMDFTSKLFGSLFKKKLDYEGYRKDFRVNFGLNDKKIALLEQQIESDLTPVIRIGEKFDLKKVFNLFNEILPKIKV